MKCYVKIIEGQVVAYSFGDGAPPDMHEATPEEFYERTGILPPTKPEPVPTPEEINAQAIAELSMSYAQEMEQAQAAIMELSMLIGGTT